MLQTLHGLHDCSIGVVDGVIIDVKHCYLNDQAATVCWSKLEFDSLLQTRPRNWTLPIR